ncbi:PLD nuclease N-terminal domain-containing protein [Jannaschia sp. R86511]|uniref:PLD nuclease N-terminal domain-containing protein n=1 Tax=Jannaschia sp. R86511 TaxID=3093853 RepID=UPI0036D215D3
MLPTILVLGFSLYCFLDVLLHPSDDPRGLPKALWAVIVLFFPVVGGVAWLVMKGREPRPRSTWRIGGGFPESERPRGPEDDPDWQPRPQG